MPGANVSQRRIRAANRLSAVRVRTLREPGIYEDGEGLRLVITPKGTKRWALRLTINGRRVERGLGVFPTVTLEDARSEALDLRRAARGGRDLRADRRRERAATTFAQAFEAFFASKRQQLVNAKHIQQWQNTMRDYVFPVIGAREIAEITPGEVLAVLEPIWFRRPETASRVLQRLRAVFDSAIVRGTRERANPCIGVARELGTDHRRVRHHPAMPWKDVPSFIRELRQFPAHLTTKLAFEFMILTAARSGEVRGALWSEMSLEKGLWIIPGNDPSTGRRMKSGEEHAVPLARRSIEILNEAKSLREGEIIFAGPHGGVLSDNTFSKLMRDRGIVGTPHGFRSAFKDWAAESGVRDEVSEAALAHTDGNRVRAAYRRTRFLEERTAVMQRWSHFATGEQDVP
jgi:integrase